jgi:low affinity Fe/Cu permease
MKNIYRHTENLFEKLVSVAIAVLGNSITFLVAFCIVIFWLSNKQFYNQDIHASISDLILGIAFLSLFLIQKSFNRFSASLQVKVNELLSSHEPANNAVMNVETKTEREIALISKEYMELVNLEKEKIKNNS